MVTIEKIKYLAIDHDPETKQLQDILCLSSNTREGREKIFKTEKVEWVDKVGIYRTETGEELFPQAKKIPDIEDCVVWLNMLMMILLLMWFLILM